MQQAYLSKRVDPYNLPKVRPEAHSVDAIEVILTAVIAAKRDETLVADSEPRLIGREEDHAVPLITPARGVSVGIVGAQIVHTLGKIR